VVMVFFFHIILSPFFLIKKKFPPFFNDWMSQSEILSVPCHRRRGKRKKSITVKLQLTRFEPATTREVVEPHKP